MMTFKLSSYWNRIQNSLFPETGKGLPELLLVRRPAVGVAGLIFPPPAGAGRIEDREE